jgi:hypothetical protein
MLVFVIVFLEFIVSEEVARGYLQKAEGSKGLKREGLGSVLRFDHTLKFTAC